MPQTNLSCSSKSNSQNIGVSVSTWLTRPRALTRPNKKAQAAATKRIVDLHLEELPDFFGVLRVRTQGLVAVNRGASTLDRAHSGGIPLAIGREVLNPHFEVATIPCLRVSARGFELVGRSGDPALDRVLALVDVHAASISGGCWSSRNATVERATAVV